MADEKLIISTDVDAKTADIEFVMDFKEDIRKLTEILGVFEPIKRAPGTALKYYTTSGTLESGANIAEGETVPLSHYTRDGETIASLDWKKWRKATSLEAISANGYSEAVTETDNKFRLDIQKLIRKELADFLKTGTGKGEDGKAITGTNLQSTLANIWGNMEIAFTDTDASPLYFANPMDLATYLGGAQITTQTAFGMTYIENFLGMYRMILMPEITKGTIITVPQENLKIYYANAGEAQGFDFTTDETGYIGVHHEADYTNLTFATNAVSALKPFCEYLDKIYIASIVPQA